VISAPLSNQSFVPCLPDNAPFTPEQRAYLNGFLAGLFSRAATPTGHPEIAAAAPLTPLSILFASQTGTAENLAKRLAKEAGKRGFAPTVHDVANYPPSQLAAETRLLIVASTYGDGEPPDNGKAFWQFLNGDNAPKLPQTRFSVCALGDTNYPKFCGFGKDLDVRLTALGAKCVRTRADCDLDYEETFAKWIDAALSGMSDGSLTSTPIEAPISTQSPKAAFGRNNPFPASLLKNQKLNGDGSEKDTRHFEISLEGSGLVYEAGDALGVQPTNCPALVEEMLAVLKCSGEEPVPGSEQKEVPLREALLRHYEITRIPSPLLQVLAARAGDETLKKAAAPDANGELTKFLWGREIIDLLLAYPSATFSSVEFVKLLKKLSPRLYSISSSPKAHPSQVHLTINIVRFESLSRRRNGVCSTFLADRVNESCSVPVFVHTNTNFRPPTNPDVPMIMVGPGTGIAPFRAFLHERKAVGAKGKNWLFFGDQRAATDFMYRDELESLQREGVLTRLDTAFSRDQAEKIYVQHRMREHAGELFAWLEAGAHFYVCGDARRMAKDVDGVLHEVIMIAGARNADQSAEYVNRLKAEKRYQRDVY
jgi:sulfite reductase (NADPH) flavoprotein alpha-component